MWTFLDISANFYNYRCTSKSDASLSHSLSNLIHKRFLIDVKDGLSN